MNYYFIKNFMFYTIPLICFVGCGGKVINGIDVSESLLVVSDEQGIDYCELLSKAVNGDDVSIMQLSILKFYESFGYDHGAVIVDLIEQIGENKFIHSLRMTSAEQKEMINWYIEAGLEYGNNPSLQDNAFEEVFPRIYFFLNSE